MELLEPPHLDRGRQKYGLGELALRHPKVDGGLGEGSEVADFGNAQQLLGIGHYGTPLVGRSTNSARLEGDLFARTISANCFLFLCEVESKLCSWLARRSTRGQVSNSPMRGLGYFEGPRLDPFHFLD